MIYEFVYVNEFNVITYFLFQFAKIFFQHRKGGAVLATGERNYDTTRIAFMITRIAAHEQFVLRLPHSQLFVGKIKCYQSSFIIIFMFRNKFLQNYVTFIVTIGDMAIFEDY